MTIEQQRTVAGLSDLLVGWLHRLMPPGPRLERLATDLTATFAGRSEPVDAAGCRAVQERANVHSRHLELHFDPAGVTGPTTGPTAGRPPTQPLTVLVGPRTYSSAEALAYHLQAHGRATVLGEPTRGAADHVTPVRLTPQVLGLLPEAEVRDAVTGGNWEGTGVVPTGAYPLS